MLGINKLKGYTYILTGTHYIEVGTYYFSYKNLINIKTHNNIYTNYYFII